MKPCPYCHSTSLACNHESDGRGWSVSCSACKLQGPSQATWSSSRLAWDQLPRKEDQIPEDDPTPKGQWTKVIADIWSRIISLEKRCGPEDDPIGPIATTNQIRQILMNELGLTRELIRGMVEDIVDDTAGKHVRKLVNEERVAVMVQRHLNSSLATTQFERTKFKEKIAKIAAESVRQQLVDRLPEVLLVDPKDAGGCHD